MTLVLEYKGGAAVPLEVEGVVPDAVASQSLADIHQLPIFHGKERCELGDFFTLSGHPADGCLEWRGDLSGVHWVAAKSIYDRA